MLLLVQEVSKDSISLMAAKQIHIHIYHIQIQIESYSAFQFELGDGFINNSMSSRSFTIDRATVD